METPDPNPGADLLHAPPGDREELPAGAGPAHAALAGAAARDSGSAVATDGAATRAPSGEGEAAPAVVAVLVTSDPGPWLEAALESLAAQEYPALSVLVLDNASQ